MADDSVCSLDMVRLRLRFEGPETGIRLDEMASSFSSDGYQSWVARVKPGGWRVVHNWAFGESSVTLGVGLMAKNCSVDMSVGFLEFNPNKLAKNDGFLRLLAKLGDYVARAELVRYDFAVDIPVSRRDVRLVKDGRKYKCEISSSVTEYLGRRNSGGYVKLYDKAVESELDVPLTRIELTCDGSWSVEEVEKHWPRVYGVDNEKVHLNSENSMAVLLLADVVTRGDSVEFYLQKVNKRTRAKLRSALESPSIGFPRNGAAVVLLQAVAWTEVVALKEGA